MGRRKTPSLFILHNIHVENRFDRLGRTIMAVINGRWPTRSSGWHNANARMMPVNPQDAQPLIPYAEIRYVGIGEITIYLVSDDELRVLERGGPSSTLLNLAIFFASTSASFLSSLIMSPPPSIRTFIIMVALTTTTGVAGAVLTFLWKRSSRDVADTINRIRARSVPPGQIVEGERIS